MTPGEAQLAEWLERLVALLLGAGGPVAHRLVTTVAGQGALLALDDARLMLRAEADATTGLALSSAATDGDAPVRCVTRADTLRAVIDGRRLLDAVIVDGTLELRAPLPSLLAFDELVRLAMALGPRHAGLRALWAEFSTGWPADAPLCPELERQGARHGGMSDFVPDAVRWARSPTTHL